MSAIDNGEQRISGIKDLHTVFFGKSRVYCLNKARCFSSLKTEVFSQTLTYLDQHYFFATKQRIEDAKAIWHPDTAWYEDIQDEKADTLVYQEQKLAALQAPFVPVTSECKIAIVAEDCLETAETMSRRLQSLTQTSTKTDAKQLPTVLNMANQTSVGGNPKKASAQEEELFRRTALALFLPWATLYSDIPKFFDRFRQRKQEATVHIPLTATPKQKQKAGDINDEFSFIRDNNGFGEFATFFSTEVSVLRRRAGKEYDFLKKHSENKEFSINVLTAAAYNLSDREDEETYGPKKHKDYNASQEGLTAYCKDLEHKIENQFLTAKRHGQKYLILSAYGCGAFSNNPQITALIYRIVIEKYKQDFNEIYFAIIDQNSLNFTTFKRVMSLTVEQARNELEKLRSKTPQSKVNLKAQKIAPVQTSIGLIPSNLKTVEKKSLELYLLALLSLASIYALVHAVIVLVIKASVWGMPLVAAGGIAILAGLALLLIVARLVNLYSSHQQQVKLANDILIKSSTLSSQPSAELSLSVLHIGFYHSSQPETLATISSATYLP